MVTLPKETWLLRRDNKSPNTQVETWHSNIKQVVEIQSSENGEIYLNWVLRRKTLKWFYLSPSGCVILKTQWLVTRKHSDFNLIFFNNSIFLSYFWWTYVMSKVLGTWFRAWGTWYMVSRVRDTWFWRYWGTKFPITPRTWSWTRIFCPNLEPL